MRKFIKRALDLVISLTGLIFLCPLFALIGLLIKIDSRGPVFFRQQRVGRAEKLFRIFKFRTMVDGAESKGKGYLIEKNDFRITGVGKFLRKFSLDELPQLLNVLKGEMSLVGPRPTLKYQIDEYTERQKLRLKVRPGITGWAQIHGRNELSWPERIEYDIRYIQNWSIWLDLRIVCATIGFLISRKGVYTEDLDKFKVRVEG